MPKVSPIQTSFSSGEFSPLLKGQVDIDRYRQALELSLNYIPTLQGGLVRRSGTYYVANTKNNGKVRLVKFEFSVTQAYVLEFGDQYVRFFRNNAQLEVSPGTPLEVATPYLLADLDGLKFTQSADVLYIVHPNYAPRTLSRVGSLTWTLSTLDFLDGPYLPINTTPFSITPSAATGSVTLTAGPSVSVSGAANNGSGLIRITTSTAHGYSTGQRVTISGVTGTTEANGDWTITVITTTSFDLQSSSFVNSYVSGGSVRPGIFASTDVGRLIRLKENLTWGWGRITAFTSAAVVDFDVVSSLTNTNAKTFFRFGSWSATTGFPSCVVFHEDRLFFSGARSTPQRIDASVTAEYTNFAPTDKDGVVIASNALSFTFNANDVNVVRWLVSDEKGLIVGTVGGEWIVRPSSSGEALTATNIVAKLSTTFGSADIQAVQVGKSTMFVQRAQRKLRELTYLFEVDGFRALDLTLLAEHITQGGVKFMSLQKEPQPILWAVRADGVLVGVTYERDVEGVKAGWHRHVLGGRSDAAGSYAIVEDVASIPSPDTKRDELWVVVKRFVNGSVVRHVEYMTAIFDDEIEQEDAFFVDSGLTYNEPLDITAATKANPIVITSNSHGLNNGEKVLIKNVKGMTELNGNSYLVAGVTTNTFTLQNLDGDDIDSTNFTTYVSGGKVRKYVSTISGLSHLEGETVSVLADGAVQPDQVVSSGAIVLDVPATVVHIGYGYKSRGKMLRLNAGSADGTSIGKTQRTHRVGFMLHRSLGLKIGMSFEEMDRIIFRMTSDELGRAPELYTGIISETIEADYNFENQICFEQDQPLPNMILAIMPQMHTQDR